MRITVGETRGRLISGIALLAMFFGISSCSDDHSTPPNEPGPIDSQFVWAVGNNDLLDGQMYTPITLALDPNSGNLYVADNVYVHEFSPQGTFLGRIRMPARILAGMAVTTEGSILLTDRNDHEILEMDKDGNIIRSWGEQGSAPGQFNYPYGVSVGVQGWIYVTDGGNSRVQVFGSEGAFIKSWIVGVPGQIAFPVAIAIDAGGMVYVGDTRNDRIHKFDADGNWITGWGSQGTGPGEFSSFSLGIGISEVGDVLTLEQGRRVQRFSPDGVFLASWVGEGDPNSVRGLGIAISETGTVYTLGLKTFGVQAYSSDGQLINQFGTQYRSAPGQFDFPYVLASAPDGSVLVGDFQSRIQRLDASGQYAGEWIYAAKQSMRSIAVGPDGSVYVLGVNSGDEARVWQYSATGEPDGHSWMVPLQSTGLNVDEQARVWILDRASARVRIYEPNGRLFASWGELGLDEGELLDPISMAVKNGNVVVLDANAIYLFSENGTFKRTITTWEDGAEGYEMIALSDQGIVYVASRYADGASMFDLSGSPLGKLPYEGGFAGLAPGLGGAVFVISAAEQVVKFEVQSN